jgi:hypothetical protein
MGEARGSIRPVVATLVLLTTTLAGCTAGVPCTAIGAEPGARVTSGVNGASVRVCDGATCGTTTLANGDNFVNLPSLRPGRKVELKVTYGQANRTTTSVVTVVPHEFQPNGASCPPSVAVAKLTLDATGRAAG